MSYRLLAGLLKETCSYDVSPVHLRDLVEKQADHICFVTHSKMRSDSYEGKEIPGTPLAVCTDLDLYASKGQEVLLMEDAIGVRKQKPHRGPGSEADKKQRNWTYTDVALLQRPDGSFEYLCAGYHKGKVLYTMDEVIASTFASFYPETDKVKLVVISDGANKISARVKRLFGSSVKIILDWYHLQDKVLDRMSMIAPTKAEKQDHLFNVWNLLWEGKVDRAIEYIGNIAHPKNEKIHQKLLTYLEKNQHRIINYKRRQEAGKTIGSGRMEKAVDCVIGQRQKNKGMSWSPKGNRALAIIKLTALNQNWSEFFPLESVA